MNQVFKRFEVYDIPRNLSIPEIQLYARKMNVLRTFSARKQCRRQFSLRELRIKRTPALAGVLK